MRGFAFVLPPCSLPSQTHRHRQYYNVGAQYASTPRVHPNAAYSNIPTIAILTFVFSSSPLPKPNFEKQTCHNAHRTPGCAHHHAPFVKTSMYILDTPRFLGIPSHPKSASEGGLQHALRLKRLHQCTLKSVIIANGLKRKSSTHASSFCCTLLWGSGQYTMFFQDIPPSHTRRR